MDTEEIRPFVLEYLHNMRNKENLQFSDVQIGVLSLIAKKGLLDRSYKDAERDIIWSSSHKYGDEIRKINEIVWELILERVLLPGGDVRNQDLPFIHLTEHGMNVVEHGEIQPHDPDGYLTQLKTEIPNIDQEIERYIIESLQAYRRGLLLSSAVTMGVASEKAFILLHEELTNSITNQAKKQKFLDLQASYRTKKKFDEVKKEVINHKSKYPRNIAENLETHLDSIFQVIRVTRNEVGHPTGKTLHRGEVFVRLQLFIEYTKIVYQLIDWLKVNQL